MVDNSVRAGVAGPQPGGEGFAGGVREAQHRVEPEAALVGRRGALLVLRVDLHQRRVDIEDDWPVVVRDARPAPHPGPDPRSRLPQALEGDRADLAEGPIQRRVRRHQPEQTGLGTQRFDVRTGLTATGQHQHRLDQHLAPIMDRQPFPGRRDPSRQRLPEAQPVRQRPQRVQPDMGHDTIAGRLDPHSPHTVTVHLSGALPAGQTRCFATPRMPCSKGPVASWGPHVISCPHELSGLT